MPTNRRAAIAALLAFIDRLEGGAQIEVRPLRGGGMRFDLDPVPERISPKETSACEQDIAATLRDVSHRLTTTRLLAEMEKRGRLHGEGPVKQTLARLVREGKLNSRRDVNPPGYWFEE